MVFVNFTGNEKRFSFGRIKRNKPSCSPLRDSVKVCIKGGSCCHRILNNNKETCIICKQSNIRTNVIYYIIDIQEKEKRT